MYCIVYLIDYCNLSVSGYIAMMFRHKEVRATISGLSYWGQKWVELTTNGTNPGPFRINCKFDPKKILIFPFVANLAQFGPKSEPHATSC